MTISQVSVGGKVTAAKTNEIIDAVNAAGLVKIVPTSVAGSGVTVNAAGLVSFSASSTVSLNGCFPSGYTRFTIIASFNRSTSLNVGMRLRLAGTDSSATNYDRQLLLVGGTSVTGASTLNDTDWENFTGTGSGRVAVDATIFEPNTTDFTQMMIETTSIGAAYVKHGMIHDVATAYDGFSWITSTGTITGSVQVYGLA